MSPRNPELEAAVLAAPHDDGRRLVYADWLEEQGAADAACAYRLLAGVGGDGTLEVGRWLGVASVASAAWQLACAARGVMDDGDVHVDDYDSVNEALLQTSEMLTALAAAAASGQAPPDAAEVEPRTVELAGFPPPARWIGVRQALSRFRDFLSEPNDHAALLDALRLSREAAAAREHAQLLAWVVGGVAHRGASPFARDASLSEMLQAEITEDHVGIDLPLPGKTGPFSFEHVMISNSTQGVTGRFWMRQSGVSPVAALYAMAAAEEFSARDYNRLTPEERREFVSDELFADDLVWAGLSSLDVLGWAYGYLEANEGEGVRVGRGKPRALFDAMEPFGAFVRGAHNPDDDFPFTFIELENAWVFSRLIY